MKFALGAFVICSIALLASAPANAQSRDLSDYVLDCAKAPDATACEVMLDGLDRDLDGAWSADYASVRNISYCLLTGCDGATRVTVEEGCAWRAVAYTLAPTGKERVAENRMMDMYCKAVPPTTILAYVQVITPKLQ